MCSNCHIKPAWKGFLQFFMPIIQTDKLSFSYSKSKHADDKALDNINISIEKGELIGIIGHTGSGKSTFVSHLNGLLKPTEGTVYFDGKNIWEKPKEIRNIRFKVGMVFQYPEYQLFEETVYKDIAYGPNNMACSEEEIDKRVREAAKLVGLQEGLLEKSPFELSGGEKRRCAIAGVMAMQPDVLLLDEPTAGLDPYGRKKLLNLIKDYHENKKNTVILVSHSMEEIARMCDKVMVINNSKVIMYDNVENVFSTEEVLDNIGLEATEICYIVNKLRNNGINLPENILSIENAAEEIAKAYNERESKHG